MKKYYKTNIVTNKAQCVHCGDIIESKHRHDFRFCSCRKIFVDGGKDYLKRGFDSPLDYKDLSETYEVEREPYEWEIENETSVK